MFEDLVDAGRQLVGRLEKYRDRKLREIPPDDRIAISRIGAWFKAARTMVETQYGPDSEQMKRWNKLQDQIHEDQKLRWERGDNEAGLAIESIHESMGLLAEYHLLGGGTRVTRVIPATRRVFIVHGHDAANTLRLTNVLEKRFSLEPIVLADQPGKGRTLIEKFEAEAADSPFAFALISPDDVIRAKHVYAQARPNVIFELGWFYGRLGRDRVCLLFKEGTAIHSDLDGISRIQFRESVEEKLSEIERELKAAGLV